MEGKTDYKKPNKLDTLEFGEVAKQKIGYRLREVLGGKKPKPEGRLGKVGFTSLMKRNLNANLRSTVAVLGTSSQV